MVDARTLLLGIFGVGWLTVLILTAASNHGEVPVELWPVLGVGIGGILAVFRVDDFARSHRPESPPPTAPQPPTPSHTEPPTAA